MILCRFGGEMALPKFGRRYASTWRLGEPAITRFAPSPTGYLHLGGLRTALFNYIVAAKTDGKFLLRIEDTDQTRLVPDAVQKLVEVLAWTNILPANVGRQSRSFEMQAGSYVQSKRLGIYKEHVSVLLELGKAYRCFCNKTRLDGLRAVGGVGTRYDRLCADISKAKSSQRASAGEPHVIRLKAPTMGTTHFDDLVYGRLHMGNSTVDDVVLVKSDGFPTYHFANVVDDQLMGINLVMRGQEWISSTPLHVLLYQAFGWSPPAFAHLPLLINPNGSKLSKRQGDAYVRHYQEAGYLPEALINFIALMGWTPKTGEDGIQAEIMEMSELIEKFAVTSINTSDALVNRKRLDWINKQHVIRMALSPSSLGKLILELERCAVVAFPRTKEYLECNDSEFQEYLGSIIKVIKERVHVIKDIPRLCPYFFSDPNYTSDDGLALRDSIGSELGMGELVQLLDYFVVKLSPEDTVFGAEELRQLVAESQEKLKMKSSNIKTILRYALTATKIGSDIAETARVLGRARVIRRIQGLKEHLGFAQNCSDVQ